MDERKMLVLISRLGRIVQIQKVSISLSCNLYPSGFPLGFDCQEHVAYKSITMLLDFFSPEVKFKTLISLLSVPLLGNLEEFKWALVNLMLGGAGGGHLCNELASSTPL